MPAFLGPPPRPQGVVYVSAQDYACMYFFKRKVLKNRVKQPTANGRNPTSVYVSTAAVRTRYSTGDVARLAMGVLEVLAQSFSRRGRT